LKRLTSLQSLALSECRQLSDLSQLASLTKLNLSYCEQLSDLSSLAGLTSLQALNAQSLTASATKWVALATKKHCSISCTATAFYSTGLDSSAIASQDTAPEPCLVGDRAFYLVSGGQAWPIRGKFSASTPIPGFSRVASPGMAKARDACPWSDRAQFLADQQSPRMKELRER
jgi:hypothetical protein